MVHNLGKALPERVLIVHLGGLGDLILLTAFVQAVRRTIPNGFLAFACRRQFMSIVQLWQTPFQEIVPIDFDPYVRSPLRAHEEDARAALAQIAMLSANLVISAERSPTWMTALIAAATGPAHIVRASAGASTIAEEDAALERLSLQRRQVEEYVVNPGHSEQERYRDLSDRLRTATLEAPAISVAEPQQRHADEVLKELALIGKRIIACFPFGNSSVPLKRWPPERFEDAIEHTAKECQLVPLLIGDSAETNALQLMKKRLRERGTGAETYIDSIQSVPLTAAILKRSAAYLGNDSGLAHLAAGLGLAGVTVYGGGTWASFAPSTPGAIGVVHPLPCFGCGWDCAFGESLCIKAIQTADVTSALKRAVISPPLTSEVVDLKHRTESELEIIGKAARTYRKTQDDRRQRFDVILRQRMTIERLKRSNAGGRGDGETDLSRLRRDLLLESERELRRLQAELKRLKATSNGVAGDTRQVQEHPNE